MLHRKKGFQNIINEKLNNKQKKVKLPIFGNEKASSDFV